MRATSVGHAGILIDTVDGSILCDPWFLPAFFGSWFVFPRNDRLPAELMERIEHPTFLYISHLHADHLDEPWLADHVDRSTRVLIPGFPTRELERKIRSLGFDNVIRTNDGEELALGPNLRIAIHVETSITDGPGGDSALVVSDGTARLVNQNDCRTDDLDALRAHGPVDLHWLQYSGAIWYPMVYEEPPQRMRELVDAKVTSQFARAMRYVEAIGARAVVPSAGPPAFLDPELFRFNVITGDELSIFPDQLSFI
ncbi:MAG: MBL fold metallo-hydrolase, partial [Ilumatobacteraceae bacterium]